MPFIIFYTWQALIEVFFEAIEEHIKIYVRSATKIVNRNNQKGYKLRNKSKIPLLLIIASSDEEYRFF